MSRLFHAFMQRWKRDAWGNIPVCPPLQAAAGSDELTGIAQYFQISKTCCCFQWADRPSPTEPKLHSKRTEFKNFFANEKKMAPSLLSLFNFSSSVIFIICIKILEWKPGFSNEKVQTRSCTSSKTPPSGSFCLSLSSFLPHIYTSISSKHMHPSSPAVCEGWGDKLWFLISPPSLAIRKASRATKDEEN